MESKEQKGIKFLYWVLGLSRFCSEKAKNFVRNMPKSYKKLVAKNYTVSVTIWFTNLANCCFNGVFDFQRGVRHFVYTQSTVQANLVPREPPREGNSPGNEVEANPILVTRRCFRSYNRAFLTPLFALIKTLREIWPLLCKISDIPEKSLMNYFVL